MTQHGFELIREAPIKELNAQAKLYRHVRTGAQLLSMENGDENKVFSVNFCTPPSDSTGLPHILEHSVLGGSRKYPLKEPFVELLKGSLATFVNAMTFPDMTVYPVASQNVKDFYNLIDVYLDAVFYPRITEATLKQEGWHYELEKLEDPLNFKGIVFNEMKGAYSSPDALIGDLSQWVLLPDTIYGLNSGGDPAVMPDLTYEQFRRFHATYYHPSNARFYFYGDDDPDERLRLVDAFITNFEQIPVDTTIASQPRWSRPRSVVKGYEAGDDPNANKGMVTVSWLLPETTDIELGMAFSLLQHILIGTPASPLRRALLESGLGEDLIGSGLSPYQKQMYFSTGLKGIRPEDAGKVEALIDETLRGLANEGIDRDTVEASMNTIEFQLRELNTGRFPRGLAVMIGMLPVWIHNGDIFAALSFEPPLNGIKERLGRDEAFFEGLIRQHLLDNPHRLTLLLQPDANVRAQREAAERARLDQAQAAMSEDDLRAIIENTLQLKAMQETPNSPEALATIPSLRLADLDQNTRVFPLEKLEEAGATVLYHDLPTNGVAYVDIGFDLHALPAGLLPYAGLFGRALLELGTRTEDFVRLAQRIGQKTGGIRPEMLISSAHGKERGVSWQFLRAKAMADRTGELVDILRDVLLTAKLDNPDRFRQIVLEEKAGKEASLSYSGHVSAMLRLRARSSEADWVGEQMGGVSQLFFLRELAEKVENDWPAVLAALEDLRGRLINRGAMLVNVTLDAVNFSRFRPQLAGLIGELPPGAAPANQWPWQGLVRSEGLVIPTQVNYVGKGANLFRHGYALHGSWTPILKYLNTTYIWDRIRVQGGAYGGFANFDPLSGNFAYVSYRDPNLLGSLDNYDAAGTFLREAELHSDEVTRSIIGAIGQMDAHLLPDAKGYTSMAHYLTGNTNERRQQTRNEVLGTTAADFRRFGEALEAVAREGVIAVVGSKDAITSANAARARLLEVVPVL